MISALLKLSLSLALQSMKGLMGWEHTEDEKRFEFVNFKQVSSFR